MSDLGIFFPVYNEKRRLESGIRKTIEWLEENKICHYQIYILDNASVDETPRISRRLEKEYGSVQYIRVERKGVGVAVRAGARVAEQEIVGYMDIDLSTDLDHLRDVVKLFEDNPKLELVNGSRLHSKSKTTGRKWYRNLTSRGLTVLLKYVFGLRASDSICGFKFFRRETLNFLIRESSADDGWFFIIELLLRAEMENRCIVELPVRWRDDFRSNIKVIPLICYYLKNIIRLKLLLLHEQRKGKRV